MKNTVTNILFVLALACFIFPAARVQIQNFPLDDATSPGVRSISSDTTTKAPSSVADLRQQIEAGDQGALEKLKNMADASNPEAQELLGSLYFAGKGVPKDDSEGFQWSLKAAMLGFKLAAVRVALAYGDGRGVEKNELFSTFLLKLLAESNSAIAQQFLDARLLTGTYGAKMDEVEGSKWLILSATAPIGESDYAQQHMDAIKAKSAIMETLDEKTKREAEVRANKWRENNMRPKGFVWPTVIPSREEMLAQIEDKSLPKDEMVVKTEQSVSGAGRQPFVTNKAATIQGCDDSSAELLMGILRGGGSSSAITIYNASNLTEQLYDQVDQIRFCSIKLTYCDAQALSKYRGAPEKCPKEEYRIYMVFYDDERSMLSGTYSVRPADDLRLQIAREFMLKKRRMFINEHGFPVAFD